eukprot:849541-Rhodomonas_salina.2
MHRATEREDTYILMTDTCEVAESSGRSSEPIVPHAALEQHRNPMQCIQVTTLDSLNLAFITPRGLTGYRSMKKDSCEGLPYPCQRIK